MEKKEERREVAIGSCLSVLKAKGVKHDPEAKSIEKGSYGMGTWAAIDCLVHYHGWILKG